MQWAVGTTVVFLLVVALGGAITGSSTIGGQSVPVEAFLTVGVDANGRPRVLAYRLTQSGRPAAPPAQAALAARVTQTNADMDQVVPRTQRVKRVWVTPDAINGEFTEKARLCP